MKKRFQIKNIRNSLILFLMLFLSNMLIGGKLTNFLLFSLELENYDLGFLSIIILGLPGFLSTGLIYVLYTKVPFTKKISFPTKNLKGYIIIQWIIMTVMEPFAVVIAVMATGSPGSGIKEMIIGFSVIWLPINVILWIVLMIFHLPLKT